MQWHFGVEHVDDQKATDAEKGIDGESTGKEQLSGQRVGQSRGWKEICWIGVSSPAAALDRHAVSQHDPDNAPHP